MVEESHSENGDLAYIPGRDRQERPEADIPLNSASVIKTLQNGVNNKVKNLRISFRFFRETLMRRIVRDHIKYVLFAIVMLIRGNLLIILDKKKGAE